ncbi:MAG: hypothetical protein Q8N63_05495 [Nanoarchaeota archaeon]|nr:hypothetical protein [Nanoarchaeota archaeon]
METQNKLEQKVEVKTSNWDYDLEKKLLKLNRVYYSIIGAAGVVLLSVGALQSNENMEDMTLNYLGIVMGAGFASEFFYKTYKAFQKLRDYKQRGL